MPRLNIIGLNRRKGGTDDFHSFNDDDSFGSTEELLQNNGGSDHISGGRGDNSQELSSGAFFPETGGDEASGNSNSKTKNPFRRMKAFASKTMDRAMNRSDDESSELGATVATAGEGTDAGDDEAPSELEESSVGAGRGAMGGLPMLKGPSMSALDVSGESGPDTTSTSSAQKSGKKKGEKKRRNLLGGQILEHDEQESHSTSPRFGGRPKLKVNTSAVSLPAYDGGERKDLVIQKGSSKSNDHRPSLRANHSMPSGGGEMAQHLQQGPDPLAIRSRRRHDNSSTDHKEGEASGHSRRSTSSALRRRPHEEQDMMRSAESLPAVPVSTDLVDSDVSGRSKRSNAAALRRKLAEDEEAMKSTESLPIGVGSGMESASVAPDGTGKKRSKPSRTVKAARRGSFHSAAPRISETSGRTLESHFKNPAAAATASLGPSDAVSVGRMKRRSSLSSAGPRRRTTNDGDDSSVSTVNRRVGRRSSLSAAIPTLKPAAPAHGMTAEEDDMLTYVTTRTAPHRATSSSRPRARRASLRPTSSAIVSDEDVGGLAAAAAAASAGKSRASSRARSARRPYMTDENRSSELAPDGDDDRSVRTTKRVSRRHSLTAAPSSAHSSEAESWKPKEVKSSDRTGAKVRRNHSGKPSGETHGSSKKSSKEGKSSKKKSSRSQENNSDHELSKTPKGSKKESVKGSHGMPLIGSPGKKVTDGTSDANDPGSHRSPGKSHKKSSSKGEGKSKSSKKDSSASKSSLENQTNESPTSVAEQDVPAASQTVEDTAETNFVGQNSLAELLTNEDGAVVAAQLTFPIGGEGNEDLDVHYEDVQSVKM